MGDLQEFVATVRGDASAIMERSRVLARKDTDGDGSAGVSHVLAAISATMTDDDDDDAAGAPAAQGDRGSQGSGQD